RIMDGGTLPEDSGKTNVNPCRPSRLRLWLLAALTVGRVAPAFADGARDRVAIQVDWNSRLRVARTHATLQVVASPPLRVGSSVHDPVLRALAELRCSLARFIFWLPYPRLAVAAL